MSDTELLPCPFCGEEADIERMGTHRMSMVITCTNCGCSVETGETFVHKNTQWNTRHITLNQARQVLAEAGMVAVPESLNAHQRHQIKLQGDYCMQECEEFYHMVLKAAQDKPNA
jgi:Lar family restriction alleviation protein